MDINFKLSWQISLDEEHPVDPILFSLLEAVEQLGSLKQATEHIGVSYRFAWGLVGKWEQRFGTPLVNLERGRGAQLTQLGFALLNANTQVEAKFSPELANFANHVKSDFLKHLATDAAKPLTVYASHGLAINSLRDTFNEDTNFDLDLHFHGSLESLNALKHQHCDVAGFHIPEGQLGQALLPQYQQLLTQQQYQLIHVVKRNQGLMYQPKHSSQLDSLVTMRQSTLRFINRQKNSGTRLLFDQLLSEANIAANDINGYQHEEFTHMAVAAMIASGAADVGFGIAPMAEKFGLAFTPLVWEHYCLAIPQSLMADTRIEHIVNTLKSNEYQQQLNTFTGYQTQLTGQPVTLEQLVG